MDLKKNINKYFIKGEKFIIQHKRKIKEISLGVLFAFSCVFVIKRFFSPPILYFSKVILEKQNQQAEEVLKETPVEAFTIKKIKTKERIDSLAIVKSDAFVDIKTQKQNMRIKAILFNEGNFVEKDQDLIQFDDTEAKSRYEEAKAEMTYRLAEFKRKEYLFSKGAASKNEVQEAEGSYEKSKGQCEEAKATLDNTLIKSPIAGTAGIIENATIGSLVSPDRTLMSVANDQNEVKITFKIPLRFINSFKLGQKILFKAEAFPQSFEGSITAVDSKVNESDLQVQASLVNINDLLKSGILGHAQIITDNEIEGILIPKTSLVKQAENYCVPVIERGKITNKLVIKGADIDADTIILTGLEIGNIVVKNANSQFTPLTDGLRVMVTKLDDKDTGSISQIFAPRKKWFSFSFDSLKLICRYILEKDLKEFEKTSVNVNAKIAKTRTVQKKLSAIGTIRSQQFVELKSHIQNSKIKNIAFQEGDTVKEGDVLIEFDNAEAKGSYNKAKGNFDSKNKIFERMKALYKEKSIPEMEFDKAKAEYEMAVAELNVSQFKLDNMTIKAPFSGTIGLLQKVHIGTLPMTDKPLASIVNDEKVFVFAKVPIKYLNTIGLGQSMTISIETYKDKTFEGSVVGIDSKVDENTQTVLLKIELENHDHLLKSGTIGRIDIITETLENAFVVPEGALYGLSSEKDIMFGIKNGKIVRFPVEKNFNFSESNQVYWVLKKGLHEGDIYVSEIGSNIRIGSPVIIDTMDGKPFVQESPKKTVPIKKNHNPITPKKKVGKK